MRNGGTRSHVRGRRAAALLLVLASAASCKLVDKLAAHDGDPCTGHVAVCRGPEVALVCHEGKYFETPCRGPQSCRVEAGNIVCDTSLDDERDKCPPEWEDTGTCRGIDTFVSCRNGRYQVLDCRGPKGCASKDDKVACDISVAVAGDLCNHEGQSACADDKTTMLTCENGKMAMPRPCRGPLGCHSPDAAHVACDEAAIEGDPCTGDVGACSLDGRAMMRCKDGKYTLLHICRGAEGCRVRSGSVGCGNMVLSEPEDPCSDGVGACSTDGKALLLCKSGKLAVAKKCACVVHGTVPSCEP